MCVCVCKIRHSTDREVALMMLLAYLSYMLAEVKTQFRNILLPFLITKTKKCKHETFILILQLFDLSSILTVFFCGIVMSHYTWHNVTGKSKVTTK